MKVGRRDLNGIDPWRLAAVVVFLGLPPAFAGLAFMNLASAIEAAQTTERTSETLVRITSELAARKVRARTPRDTGPIYLSSTSDSLARAEIQTLLTRLVATASGRLIETQGLAEAEPGRQPEGRGRVSLQLTFDINNDGLLELLHAVETGLPLLIVRGLDVRRGLRGEASAGDGLLRVTLTAEGHWRSRAT